MNTMSRVKEILRDCCGGGASLATEIIHEEFIVIPRSELPEVSVSNVGNGYVTALAQERYQPQLRLEGDVQNTGAWSRRIAYANLAVAEAIEARRLSQDDRREELARELSPLLGVTFSELSPAAKNAIDRIIELEQSK